MRGFALILISCALVACGQPASQTSSAPQPTAIHQQGGLLPLLSADVQSASVVNGRVVAKVAIVNTALISDITGRAAVNFHDRADKVLGYACSPFITVLLKQSVVITIEGNAPKGYDHASAVVWPHDNYAGYDFPCSVFPASP